MGTPLLAVENGVIANVGVGTLGGTKLWVYGESGTRYYYAHLIAYADGIVEGTPVRAGDVIGYVGNTGNAITTPPHCHFEIHPDGGDAIDPYPLLHAVDQIDGRHVLPNLYDDPRGPGL
jgi:murein DD-endopeptidase MepM/ murein hydrolase activator NlpD